MPSIYSLTRIPRAYRRLGRFRQIADTFMKYGFVLLVDLMRNRFSGRIRSMLTPWKRPPQDRYRGISAPERLRMALADLGPTFVKLGQILATRQDIVPPDYIEELSKLQDNCPAISFEAVRERIREELGGELEEFFSEFDETPVGAASIAQGHRARLKSGEEVFVKLQRPGIEASMLLDLEILKHLAALVERQSEELAAFHPVRVMEQFAQSLTFELDFLHELSNQQKFARQFAGREGLVVPKVYPQYCTRHLLVMEFIQGIKGTRLDKMREAGLDLVALSHLGADLLLEQYFDHGFFHADPHPGNIFFLPGNRLCYIDFGQMGRITDSERRLFAELMQNFVARNYRLCAEVLLELTEHDGEPDMNEMERDIADFAEMYLTGTISQLDVPAAVTEMYNMCNRLHLSLRPQLYLLLKALAMQDTLGMAMNPKFEILAHIRPFVMKTALKRLDPKEILKDLKLYGSEVRQILAEYPRMFRQLNRQILDGKATVNVNVDSIDRMNRVFDGVFNRLAAAVVLAAMIIGSSIVVHANPKPHWYDTSIMGVLGFAMSGIFGIVWLWDVFRHRGG